uniref:NADH-ubiquinone oxidoreductase chain 4L n=1 Tax=Proisotoma minuta TaxID=301521 RepID=A0A8K1HJ51_9HEXA|nr:NADH dehydrogenase subunit 4L [Proisotoma minuta]
MLPILLSVLGLGFSGAWVFSSKREHLLSMLLSLEYLSLGVYLMMLAGFVSSDLFYSLIYITFTACEGALGLSILVIMSRTHGGDYFKTFSFF